MEKTTPESRESRERADKIIEIIEGEVPITDDMKHKIIALFQPIK